MRPRTKQKQHVAIANRSAWGFRKPHHNRPAPLARQQPLYSVVPDPIAFPVSKALTAACPGRNRQVGGVVNKAKNHSVVAEKPPGALYIKR